MRPLGEWDADYLDEVAPMDETASLEKKSSLGFDPKKGTAKAVIAKQVCAFANSGHGFIAFGFKDKDKSGVGLDDGVPDKVGDQSVKDWAEALIPTLLHPPIEGCEARFIQHPTHQPDRGVLVIAVPLSERRPHWTRDDEKPYLRAGAHSIPMPMQIFADMLTRGSVPRVNIVDSGLSPWGAKNWYVHQFDGLSFPINPLLCLESGPICEVWACELRETSGIGEFRCNMIPLSIDFIAGLHTCYIRGGEPLFPSRKTPVLSRGLDFRLCLPLPITAVEIAFRVYAASAPSVEKRFSYRFGTDGLRPVKH